MPSIKFMPQGILVTIDPGTKILAAARREKVPIRFGCGAGACGQCAVRVSGNARLRAPRPSELGLLTKIGLTIDGTVRLACQTYVESGDAEVDLDFQQTYDPSSRRSEG